MSSLLTHDRVRTGYIENADGTGHIVREQLVAPIVDTCKELHNAGLHGSKSARHLASIPAVVVEHYCNVNGITLGEFMQNHEHTRRIINDPAFADFRIAPGRI